MLFWTGGLQIFGQWIKTILNLRKVYEVTFVCYKFNAYSFSFNSLDLIPANKHYRIEEKHKMNKQDKTTITIQDKITMTILVSILFTILFYIF